MNGRIVIVSGFSGVGKGTLVNRLFELERTSEPIDTKLWLSKSNTTRLPRDDKQDNYHYISFDEYRSRIANGDYLEHTEYQCVQSVPFCINLRFIRCSLSMLILEKETSRKFLKLRIKQVK